LTTNEDKVAILLVAINVLVKKEMDHRKISRKLAEVILPNERNNLNTTKDMLEKILQEVDNCE
jgi:hypothetical protein